MAWDCAVLINVHPILGLDLHNPWPFGSPVPSPAPILHFYVTTLDNASYSLTALKTSTVESLGFNIIQRGSDIGPFVIHLSLPPHILTPVIWASSGSVSEFGVFSVKANNKPVAVAVLKYSNFNLNCQGPTSPLLPMPTGVVFAYNTTMAGMRLGDFLAGVVAMAFDMALQGALNFAYDRIFSRCIGQFLGRALGPFYNVAFRLQVEVMVPMILSMFFVGSPVGFSLDSTPVAKYYGSWKERQLEGVAEYWNDPYLPTF